MKKHVLLIAAIGISLVVAIVMARQAAEVRAGRHLNDEVASLSAEIANMRRAEALKQGLMALQLSHSSPVEAGAKKSDPPVAGSGGPAQAEPPTKKQHDPDNQEIVAQLDQQFYTEPRDAAWSNKAAQQIIDVLTAGLEPGTSVRGAECRKTFCRIETSHRDLKGFGKFVDSSFGGRVGKLWNGAFASFVTDRSSETMIAVNYLARESETLPPVGPVDE